MEHCGIVDAELLAGILERHSVIDPPERGIVYRSNDSPYRHLYAGKGEAEVYNGVLHSPQQPARQPCPICSPSGSQPQDSAGALASPGCAALGGGARAGSSGAAAAGPSSAAPAVLRSAGEAADAVAATEAGELRRAGPAAANGAAAANGTHDDGECWSAGEEVEGDLGDLEEGEWGGLPEHLPDTPTSSPPRGSPRHDPSGWSRVV
jgi:hypothetical protein